MAYGPLVTVSIVMITKDESTKIIHFMILGAGGSCAGVQGFLCWGMAIL